MCCSVSDPVACGIESSETDARGVVRKEMPTLYKTWRSHSGEYFDVDLLGCNQGIFATERAGTRPNAVPEALSQNDANRNAFPGVGITNTTPLLPNFGSLFVFQNLFQKKMALVATLYGLVDRYKCFGQTHCLQLHGWRCRPYVPPKRLEGWRCICMFLWYTGKHIGNSTRR
jgi:hypothetical protein